MNTALRMPLPYNRKFFITHARIHNRRRCRRKEKVQLWTSNLHYIQYAIRVLRTQ